MWPGFGSRGQWVASVRSGQKLPQCLTEPRQTCHWPSLSPSAVVDGGSASGIRSLIRAGKTETLHDCSWCEEWAFVRETDLQTARSGRRKKRTCSRHQSRDSQTPDIQPNPHPAQLEEISSCLVDFYLGEEMNPYLFTVSFQRRIVCSKPLLLQAKNPSSLSCTSSDFCSRSFTS